MAILYTSTELILKSPSDDYDMLLVFGIQIKDGITVTKTDISRLTRALNRRSFNRPVVLLIRYGNLLSFSAAERGQYQHTGHQGEKIGRISILRNIVLNERVHAGHERILLQLRINPLKVTSFKDLYTQWQEVFNLKTLNNDFYKKVADWYFWATKVVKFPVDHYKTLKGNENKTNEELQAEANQIALIRFITRIVFVWFLKSKDQRLIPAVIFDYNELKNHLRFNDEFESNYYKAILQNLFFASFNTKIDSQQRTFTDQKRTTFLENRYRYASLFMNPEESVKTFFSNIPFLNGGLFFNLDYKVSDKKTVRVDWFSDPAEGLPKNRLYFPDFLFFDKEHEEDLSDFYETRTKQKVKGLISILKEYYFTIEENTPLVQEIALDPELLGKIFENLLASYNPETRTTARKQTGSYYTPREIVNYMVDESLVAYLITKLSGTSKVPDSLTNIELESKLRALFGYETETNPFEADKETTNAIIAHLSECKILDPACGSGAFPMGVLHQIVHALKKLDKNNEQWKQVQYERLIAPEVAKITGDISTVQKLSSDEARKLAEKQLEHELNELLDNFARHDHNYTRKLHLIENCIYGVDIQPIAIHISKLRFFISLLVDQNIDFKQRDKNYLLNPLPNLETKFVAANTLIPLNPGGQLTTREEKIIAIENSIKTERKKYFDCKSREEKLKIERRDEELRKAFAGELKRLTEQGKNNLLKHIEKIEAEIETHNRYKATAKNEKDKARIIKGIESLKKDLEKQKKQLEQFAGGDEVANKILNFNPYDANSSAPFFDAEIMFTLQPDIFGGFFDVVIGNPPYVEHKKLKHISSQLKKYYKTYSGTADLYVYFYEQGINSLKNKGTCTLITSNKFIKTEYGKNLREFLTNNYLKEIIDFTDIHVFDALVTSCVVIVTKGKKEEYCFSFTACNDSTFKIGLSNYILKNRNIISAFYLSPELWLLERIEHKSLKEKIEAKGTKIKNIGSVECYRGVTTGFNPAFIIDSRQKEEFIKKDPRNADVIKPLLQGRNIKKWFYNSTDEFLLFIPWHFPLHDNYELSGSSKLAEKSFKEKYISIYEHLLNFKKDLNNRNKEETGIRYEWYALQRCANTYYNEFEKQEKIIWGLTADKWAFAYDNKKYFLPSNGYILTSNVISIKFLLSILNSKLLNYYFSFIGIMTAGGAYTLKQTTVSEFPIATPENVEPFIKIVDKILFNNKNFLIISNLEKQLNLMVYKLYELTYDEVGIIDPGIEKLISRKDYERMDVRALSKYDIKG